MEYCGSLGAYLFNAYGAAAKGIILETTGSGIFLEVDTAIPCGLILSELLSNALKYAFPGARKGTVRIAASLNAAGGLDLIIGDDGVGLPPDLDLEHSKTLGLRLVHKLTDQLHGSITADSVGGAAFHLSIPLHGRKRKELNNG
jgi:two-component sensor histidine kinase